VKPADTDKAVKVLQGMVKDPDLVVPRREKGGPTTIILKMHRQPWPDKVVFAAWKKAGVVPVPFNWSK
jgi:hypothetical protein